MIILSEKDRNQTLIKINAKVDPFLLNDCKDYEC